MSKKIFVIIMATFKRKRMRRKVLKGGANQEEEKENLNKLIVEAQEMARNYLEKLKQEEKEEKQKEKQKENQKSWLQKKTSSWFRRSRHTTTIAEDYKNGPYKNYAYQISDGKFYTQSEDSVMYDIKDLVENPITRVALNEYIKELIEYFTNVDSYLNNLKDLKYKNLMLLHSHLFSAIFNVNRRTKSVLSIVEKQRQERNLAEGKAAGPASEPAGPASEPASVPDVNPPGAGGYRRTKRRRSRRSRHK